MTPPQYHLENIPKTTDFSSFDCGDDDLNDFLISDALQHQGGRFITVDAKNSARGFYQRYGFRIVPSQKNEEIVSMYLDFQKYYQDE